jgi:hypothetical protein
MFGFCWLRIRLGHNHESAVVVGFTVNLAVAVGSRGKTVTDEENTKFGSPISNASKELQ